MTRQQTPLPRHIREKINRLAHMDAMRHETETKADLTRRLLEARAAGGFEGIAPALSQIESELGAGGGLKVWHFAQA